MSDPVRTDAPRTPAPEADAPEADLAALLARWSEVAPEECCDDGNWWLISQGEDNAWPVSDDDDIRDCGLVIAGVIYHAARRGLLFRLEHDVDADVSPARSSRFIAAWLGGSAADVDIPDGDGAAALRAAATALLSAYIDALASPGA